MSTIAANDADTVAAAAATIATNAAVVSTTEITIFRFAERLSALLSSLERFFDILVAERRAPSSGRGTFHDLSDRQKVHFRNSLLRICFTHFDAYVQQLVRSIQVFYLAITRLYFTGLQRSIREARKKDREESKKRRNEKQKPVIVPPATDTLIMDYLSILFHDHPDIVGFFRCVSSMHEFEESLIPFREPIVRERGGFLNRFCKLYELTCPLDEQVFMLLVHFRREELYPIVVKKIHDNVSLIKFCLAVVHKALEMHEEPEAVARKINDIWKDAYGLFLNLIYQWLLSLDGHDMKSMFAALIKKLQVFNDQLPQLVSQLKEDVLNATQQQQQQHQQQQQQQQPNTSFSSTSSSSFVNERNAGVISSSSSSSVKRKNNDKKRGNNSEEKKHAINDDENCVANMKRIKLDKN